MPESRTRKKAAKPAPLPLAPGAEKPNPPWFVPTFVTLLVLGLVWVVVTYVSSSRYPIPALGSWNLGVGFGLILVGFGMTMRWR
ncbi:MAG TPA: hypothetical protein DHV14_10335 [Micrococcales bacterium]|uniref:Cell division protein CrgA n=1 Tax=Miniimonas arenae TaxID=676201 RepID=A0A5C5B8I1_9MICO|nr:MULTISPECIES: cell division protein CrgA [Miniimonas]TNU73188.1 cell division protein CrgA [Miniimonas arenae]HCX85507.1 hypothetical protein [Micrococcales bacterium]